MKELLVFTHNDLDAIGFALNVEFAMPNIPKKYFYTNYANITKITDDIISYQKEHGNTHLLIGDVSFSTSPEDLTRLYNLGLNTTLIDHHLYPDGFFEAYPNLKVKHEIGKCATLLANEYFKNTGKNPHLDKLSKLIDVYDIWQVGHPAFPIAQDMNEYFWKHDLEFLRDKFIECDYNLPSDYTGVVAKIHADYEAALEDYKARKLIHRFGDITVCFVNEWFNQILIEEMKNSQNFVIGISSFGITRVRINKDADFDKAKSDKLRIALTGTSNTGHEKAFTYKVDKSPSFERLTEEAQKIVTQISEIR